MPPVTLFPLQSYTFATKEAQRDEEANFQMRLQKLQTDFEKNGMRRSVEAVLLVHEHKHPHVLMFQMHETFFRLPGDYLQPGEDEVTGLRKRLIKRLGPENESEKDSTNSDEKENSAGGKTVMQSDEWVIGDCISTYYRPNFEAYMYPYCPPHISRPKEIKKTYIVHLPDKKILTVPNNMKLIAVPLFELYDNSSRYGQQLSALPHVLSHLKISFTE